MEVLVDQEGMCFWCIKQHTEEFRSTMVVWTVDKVDNSTTRGQVSSAKAMAKVGTKPFVAVMMS